MANKSENPIKSMVLPPLVLAIICAVCCGVLAFANSVTKDKIAAAEADAIQSSLQELPDAGNFTEIENFQTADNDKATATGLYVDENGQSAVLITADGYNKGGLQVVIGVDAEGAVSGISFVSVGETPGLGTKVQSNPELLTDHLIGLSDADAVEAVDGITGATYSSKGMKAAVTCALDTVNANREVLGI
jgi:electron transport complex protein RnfG